ncbi:DUF6529 family protein [Streptomyces sp. NPDC001820]|uniref:DUF6529 family protein n=1 Tax=Streptomyces sp. NPDC001820 TaxID=3364613 RepID=UPI00368970B0
MGLTGALRPGGRTRPVAGPVGPRGLGCRTYSTRQIRHTLPGCFFYGTLSAKMLGDIRLKITTTGREPWTRDEGRF